MTDTNKEKIIFKTSDPIDREIKLKTETWNIHITHGHNELYKQEGLVKKIIENPAYILKDKDFKERENYYDLCNFHDGSLSILKVVVDFSTSTGNIVTAYPIKQTHSQAVIIKGGVVYERK